MYILHPDKLARIDQVVGKKKPPAPRPSPTVPKPGTYQLRPNLVENLAARLHAKLNAQQQAAAQANQQQVTTLAQRGMG